MKTAKRKAKKPTVRRKKMGRPLKYETPEEMQILIDQYFDECYKQKHTKVKKKIVKKTEDGEEITYAEEWVPEFYPDGQPIMEYVQPVTITGLALRLNMSREDLINYEKRDNFFDTVKRAKARVQQYVEYAMMGGKTHPTAAIFNLKNNYNWKDKTESEVTNTHMHLNGMMKASYQEADKAQLAQPRIHDLPEATRAPYTDEQSIEDEEKNA